MISDEAVEAAAKVYRDQQTELGYPKWEDLPEDGREWRRDYMRKALEAAAPHMQQEPSAASVWDEAVTTLYMGNAINQDHLKAMWERNPYRSQA